MSRSIFPLPFAAARLGQRQGAWGTRIVKVATATLTILVPQIPPVRGGEAAEQNIAEFSLQCTIKHTDH